MIYISTSTVILYAFLSISQTFGETVFQATIDQTPLAVTCSAETVAKVFSAIVYIDLVSAHDPEAVFGHSRPSKSLQWYYYHEKIRIFKQIGFPNPEELAMYTHSPIKTADEFRIDFFYFAAATTYGEFLVGKGHLNCDNVIQLATAYFEHEERQFNSSVSISDEFHIYFEATLAAILLSFEDLLEDLGYTVEENEDNWKTEIVMFYEIYKKYAPYIHDRSWWAHV